MARAYLTGGHDIDKAEEVNRYAAVMERLSIAGTSPDRTTERQAQTSRLAR